MSKRVFVLDFESITPLGVGQEEILNSLKSNTMAGQEISKFSTDGLKNHGAAFIDKNLASLYADVPEKLKEVIEFDRKFELLISTYKLFEKRLKTIFKDHDPEKAGVILGVGLDVTPLEQIEPFMHEYKNNAEVAFQKTLIDFNTKENQTLASLQNPLDLSSIYLAGELNLASFQKTIITACTSSTQAIGMGYKSLKQTDNELVVVGGTDSIINLMAYTAFGKLGIVAKSDKSPKEYCKPFDQNRNGTLVGEAAGLCVLASEEYIIKNNLKPKFEILGCGNSLDGHKITSADPSGDGMMRALQMALDEGKVSPSDIDYINLHGTATRLNDELEIKALAGVMGEESKLIPVSSTKSRHGHAIAAAGIQEFNLLCSCMENDFIPGNMNLETPIDGHGLDLIKKNKSAVIKVGMTNNFAFGGVNSSIVVKRCLE